ncbi:hypothetical protein NB636_08115 [Oxalobacter aliiformigenes]|uniref:hypothetical protein n=1 Tax=Oxalobacter aliiformigenes TaxID=2946593 RepID=UPI0022AEEEFE|nr:hypothetical protein [Oxalobacter aliiformigenes]MCZ4065919.1 hypothetical protein [Oxalobacter aliiformigenes]WAV98672.1 hypothetical protein NB636_08115 [Oxalobacter aliiformigenes]
MNLLSTRIKYILDNEFQGDVHGKQIQLSKIAGASKSVVNQWISDRIKSLNIDYALNIEKKLGYDHIWLITGKGPIKLKDRPRDWPFAISRALFDQLDESDKKDIDRYIKMVFRDWQERNKNTTSPGKSRKVG